MVTNFQTPLVEGKKTAQARNRRSVRGTNGFFTRTGSLSDTVGGFFGDRDVGRRSGRSGPR